MDNFLHDKYLSLFEKDKFSETAFQKLYFIKCLLPHLPKNRDAKILDIGCGHGFHLAVLKELGYENCFGIDISKEQIEHAISLKITNVDCIDPLLFLQDKENSFDAILLLDVLEHIERGPSLLLLKMVHASLRRGGLVCMQTPNALSPFTPLRYSDITHVSCYTVDSLKQSFRFGGFSCLRFFSLFPPVHGIKSMIRNFLWRAIFHPILKALFYCLYGSAMGNIYTANILTIAKK